MDTVAFVTGLLALLAALVACAVTAALMTRRMKEKSSALNKLDGGMASLAMG